MLLAMTFAPAIRRACVAVSDLVHSYSTLSADLATTHEVKPSVFRKKVYLQPKHTTLLYLLVWISQIGISIPPI